MDRIVAVKEAPSVEDPTTLVLFSPYTPEQCAERLRRKVRRWDLLTSPWPGQVFGRVSARRFRLGIRRPLWVDDEGPVTGRFTRTIHGRFLSEHRGTRIEVEAPRRGAAHSSAMIMTLLALGYLALRAGADLLASPGLAALAGGIVLLALLLGLGRDMPDERRWGDLEESALIALLRRTLDAKVVERAG